MRLLHIYIRVWTLNKKISFDYLQKWRTNKPGSNPRTTVLRNGGVSKRHFRFLEKLSIDAWCDVDFSFARNLRENIGITAINEWHHLLLKDIEKQTLTYSIESVVKRSVHYFISHIIHTAKYAILVHAEPYPFRFHLEWENDFARQYFEPFSPADRKELEEIAF